MDLASLLKAWEDAKALAEAKPEDKSLQKAMADAKKAYDDAKAEADAQDPPGEGEGEGDVDESKLDDKTKRYLAKLRKENAGHRTKAKDLASKVKTEQERTKAILKAAGIETDDDEPEEKLKVVSSQNSNLTFRNAILESAVEQGIPKGQLEFYEFLVTKATNALEEGEELSDEALAEIVKKVKAGSSKEGANSTVGGKGGAGGGGNPPPANDGADKITLERFCSMSIMEKSKLYETNSELYTTLMREAKLKKKLV